MRLPVAAVLLGLCLLAGCAMPADTGGPRDGGSGADAGGDEGGDGGGDLGDATAAPGAGSTPRPTDTACPGHWHSTMKVYVHGREASFDNHTLEAGRTPLASHLHRGDLKYQWHWEPATRRCIPFQEAAAYAGMSIAPGRLELTGDDHGGTDGVHVANGTHRLWLRHQVAGGDWLDIGADDLNARQLQSQERLLVAFGAYTEEELASLHESVPVTDRR